MNEYFAIQYLGNTLDEFNTLEEAEAARTKLVNQVMNDELPDFLTADDFDGREDCEASMEIVSVKDDFYAV